MKKRENETLSAVQQRNSIPAANLIIVEGLPGSGKSTTASLIADELAKRGKKVVCFDEGADDHPADFKDYDFPDFKTEQSAILQRWREFVSNADEKTIYVFNCVFLQNPMCETMMRFDLDFGESQDYIAQISKIIRPLNPLIIYIDQPDPRQAIGQVLEERGSEWLNAVIEYHTSQGYGKRHHLQGFEGYIRCLKERRIREISILRTLDLDSFIISQDLHPQEFRDLFCSARWSSPTMDQIEHAIANSSKSFVIRHNGQAIGMISWLGDYGMHWFLKDFVVHKDFQGKMIGTLLYRFSENAIQSSMQPGWKVCLDVHSAKGQEEYYRSLGFQMMSKNRKGSGMEKMIESKSL